MKKLFLIMFMVTCSSISCMDSIVTKNDTMLRVQPHSLTAFRALFAQFWEDNFSMPLSEVKKLLSTHVYPKRTSNPEEFNTLLAEQADKVRKEAYRITESNFSEKTIGKEYPQATDIEGIYAALIVLAALHMNPTEKKAFKKQAKKLIGDFKTFLGQKGRSLAEEAERKNPNDPIGPGLVLVGFGMLHMPQLKHVKAEGEKLLAIYAK